MKRITINEAIEALEQDKTAHKVSILFVVGNNHPELNSERDRDLGNIVRIDAGKCYNIRTTIYRLASCSLFGGIYME